MSIPKILHQVWVGSPVPDKHMSNMADWAGWNPDHRYMLWTRPLPDMLNLDLYERAAEFVKPDAIWQFRADLLRYEVLHRYGGFYADTDTKPLRPLPSFAGFSEWCVAEDEKWHANTYLATEPCTDLFWALIERQRAHLNTLSPNAAASVASGPQYTTPIWDEFDGHVDYETKLWFPYGWREVRDWSFNKVEIPEDAYSIHEWQHSRDIRKRARARHDTERKGQ